MIIGFLLIWLVTTLGLGFVTVLVPGVHTRSVGDLLLAALVLGVINALIRPLLWVLTLPLTVFTSGKTASAGRTVFSRPGLFPPTRNE